MLAIDQFAILFVNSLDNLLMLRSHSHLPRSSHEVIVPLRILYCHVVFALNARLVQSALLHWHYRHRLLSSLLPGISHQSLLFLSFTTSFHQQQQQHHRHPPPHPQCCVGCVGGVRGRAAADALIADGDCDLVSLSRPLIRQPDLIKRWKEGKNLMYLSLSLSLFDTHYFYNVLLILSPLHLLAAFI